MFIGIDGEGKNNVDGTHRYTLLASSNLLYVEDDNGLSTATCLDFLCSLVHTGTLAKLVGFSVDYDINMMLGDLRRLNLQQLWQTGKTLWVKKGTRYYIEYIPAKHLTVTRYRNDKRDGFTLWDTWGFFQCSFVKALQGWHVGTEEVWERIHAMKEQRGDFAHIDDEAIRRYCLEECTLLAELVTKLDTTFWDAGIKLKTWQGGGSAAVALLQKEHVKKHVRQDSDGPVYRPLLCAYFGGRAEVFHLGEHKRVWNYDINSAYPTATLSLPTLRGVWRRGSNVYQTGLPYTLCRVQWNVGTSNLAPFPYRRINGKIAYYRSGGGWYHGIEVDTALSLYPPGTITVLEWWEYVPESDAKPFAFVADYYQKRLELKRVKDMRERPYKLALNSLYGKTAQGRGYNGEHPPYQSYLWAGIITATTRAAMLRAAYPYRDALVGMATDGIFLTQPIEGLDTGENLGQWEENIYEHFFLAQPGVYVGIKDGEVVTRNRGFSAKELNFDRLRREWLERGIGAQVSYEVERFAKLGEAMPRILHRDYSTWKCWTKRRRDVTITLPHKLEHPTIPGKLTLLNGPSAQSTIYTPKADGWAAWADTAAFLEELEVNADDL